MRLNRFLSVSGAASRRKGEDLIRDGRVVVNGEPVIDPARDVNPEQDVVTLDGRVLSAAAPRRYFVMNKPTGCIVSRGDTHQRQTIYDLLAPGDRDVFPVGRLDADTTGVLILTDDGDLAHRLMHPSWEIDKVYRAEIAGELTEATVRALETGIELDEGKTSPATVRKLSSKEWVSLVEITIHEGHKRQVRRMFQAVGHHVRGLARISFDGITVRGLPIGSYRPLIAEEIDMLQRSVQGKKSSE